MKNWHVIGTLFIFFMGVHEPSFSLSNIYLDVNGAYTDAGDLEKQFGAGLTVAYALHENANAFFRTIFSSRTEDPNTPQEVEYDYSMYLAGFQYRLRISESPAFWTANIAAGWTQGKLDFSETNIHYSDDGLAVAITIGFLFEATQNISAYIEAGYHYATYSHELSEADVKGFQLLFGIRFTVWGKNRTIFQGY